MLLAILFRFREQIPPCGTGGIFTKISLRKLLALALTPALLLGTCAGCGNSSEPETTKPKVSQAAVEALDGKKIIFIGNSFTQSAFTIMPKPELIMTQQERTGVHGLFYELCKANGAEVSITNWCFGGHDITDTFGAPCGSKKECKGQMHEDYLTDRYFDYVAIQPYIERQYSGDIMQHLTYIMDFFKKENPNVKFLLLVPHMTYDENYKWNVDVETLKGSDILVCNWGKMLQDIVKGDTQVPGAVQSYFRPTFVVSVDATDGYHQNILAGYITALMVYSAITGDSAVGQPYDFCDDPTVDPAFNLEAYKAKKYVYEPYTNFIEVFRSEADMKGLQQLVDQYIAAYK